MCVKVISVDSTNGFLRVSLKQVPNEQTYNTHDNATRKVPVVRDGDFAPLEKKIPEWKETTLKKIRGDK